MSVRGDAKALGDAVGGIRHTPYARATYHAIERTARELGARLDSSGIMWLLACEGFTEKSIEFRSTPANTKVGEVRVLEGDY